MAEPALLDGAAPGAGGGPGPRRLGDPQVEQRLGRLDELLAQVEATPGPAGALAAETVTALAEVYGEALARALAAAATSSGPERAVEAMVSDPLLGHLLALHGIHPEPVDRRIARALDTLRPGLGAHAGDVALLGVADEPGGPVAEIRLPAGCGAAGIGTAVREAVLAAAPEVVEVRAAPALRPPAFVPLDALLRPAGRP